MKTKVLKKQAKSLPSTVVTAFAEPAAGPGWANTPVWVILQRADGTFTRECGMCVMKLRQEKGQAKKESHVSREKIKGFVIMPTPPCEGPLIGQGGFMMFYEARRDAMAAAACLWPAKWEVTNATLSVKRSVM